MSEAQYFEQFMGDIVYYVPRSHNGTVWHGHYLFLDDAIECCRLRKKAFPGQSFSIARLLNIPGEVISEILFNG